eukprot:6048591-Amphidinium_carterae.2
MQLDIKSDICACTPLMVAGLRSVQHACETPKSGESVPMRDILHELRRPIRLEQPQLGDETPRLSRNREISKKRMHTKTLNLQHPMCTHVT